MLYDLNNITIAKDGDKIVLTMTPEWFTAIIVGLIESEEYNIERNYKNSAYATRELINRLHDLDDQINQ